MDAALHERVIKLKGVTSMATIEPLFCVTVEKVRLENTPSNGVHLERPNT